MPTTILETLRTSHASPAAIARLQRRRLRDLIRYARTASPFYRRWYRGLPADVDDLLVLPPVDKRTLMSEFDDWVTDPAVTLQGLRRDFLPNLDLVGVPYLGRYRVMTTSGTTGEPAIILHDPTSWRVLQVLGPTRPQPLYTRLDLGKVLRRGLRSAAVYATGGHYGAAVMAESARRVSPLVADRTRSISVLRPVEEIVGELNAFQPTFVSGYPSALAMLAAEQRAGRLHIEPLYLLCAGELMSDVARREIVGTFGAPLVEGYAATEVPALSLQCIDGRLHVNTDWYTFEPVDEDRRPVPVGEESATVLVSNLANRIQPIIRYDLGDRVTLERAPCTCGSPFPVVTVEGRTNDVLTFERPDHRPVAILPLALGSAIEETPGLRRFQAIGTGPHALTVRIDVEQGYSRSDVWPLVEERVRAFLGSHGVADVAVEPDDKAPEQDPRSGKLRQVIRAGVPVSTEGNR
ncbi:MAG: AMP-binding protein [Actinomycetales bacterium]|nr:AMP-binding protein [Actinomycetales bacterium]